MAISEYQWWEVTADYIQVKFTQTLDPSTLTNANIALYDDAATPNLIASPFKIIDIARDYSSISRLLTLWWSDSLTLASGNYELRFTNLKTFLGVAIDPFSFIFEWIADFATPNANLQPDRTPVEVEDYSIKTPGWSIIDSSTIIESATPTESLVILDLLPPTALHHYLAVDENRGRIDILFNKAIASNFVTPLYFKLESKEIKKGVSTWSALNTLVLSNLNNTIISIYLPGVAVSEPATPIIDPIYSYLMSDEELADYYWFETQKKYRLIISSAVGTP